jgi:hypothetical protein
MGSSANVQSNLIKILNQGKGPPKYFEVRDKFKKIL